MPNGTDITGSDNTIKASSGAIVPSANAMASNNYVSVSPNTPDEGQSFQTQQSVTDFGLGAPALNTSTQPSSTNFVDSIIQQNFQSSNITNSSGNIFNTAILNRDVSLIESSIASNIAFVQTEAKNIFSSFISDAPKETINNILQPNILNNYDNVTYHFKLMLAQEGALINNSEIPTTNLYVIAETGVSATFSIKSVEIESIVGPNDRTKNTTSSIYKISICENQGLSLIDRLFEAAIKLGIKNIMNVPMLLELSFKGYTDNGVPTEVSIGKRSWRVQLMDMPAKMDMAGSEYSMSFVSINDYGFHRFASASVIKQPISYSVEKIGDFFDNLGDFLTLQDALLASKGDQTRNEYEFVVQPEMKNWVVGQAADIPNAPSMFIDNDGKRSVVLNKGLKLEDIVDNIFATTKEANEKANPSSSPQVMNKPQDGNSISKILNITCESKILGYNQNNNEYVRKFTYYINLYDAFRALPDKPDNSDQSQRIKYMLQDALRKKYSYVFTNSNTEVINLNLELNNLWRHAATYYTTAMHRSNNNASNYLIRIGKDNNNIDDIRGTQNPGFAQDPSKLGSSDKNQFKADINQGLDSGISFDNVDTSQDANTQNDRLQLQERLQQLQKSGTVDTAALKQTIATQDKIDNIIPIEGLNTDSIIPGISAIPQLTNLLSISGLPRFLSPTPQTSSNLIELLPGTDAQNPLLNMFIKQSDPALDVNRVNENIEVTTDFSRSIFGIISNQMYAGIYSDLLQIDLDVRGDPFWLGETDSEIINRLKTGTSREPSINGQYANYIRGENSLFLTFKTPRAYNENTGFVDVKENTTFAGVYNVRQILHTFSEGKFVQKLTATRDLNIDPNQLKKYVS